MSGSGNLIVMGRRLLMGGSIPLCDGMIHCLPFLPPKGNREEALIGLEFVLRLDPAFVPATNLKRQLGTSSDEIDLGEVELKKGQNLLIVEMVGAYVEGRPIPISSSFLTRLASVYLGGF